jgi:hypothetical protein
MKQASSLGLEYQRRLQKVKFAITMYGLVIKQLETARLDDSGVYFARGKSSKGGGEFFTPLQKNWS